MIRIYSTFIFLLSAIVMFSQELPIDPQIRYGKLENGMTYYIRQNDTEKGKVCMKFAVEIGGIHEEDYEDGMAHFVEHMAFSGGKHFTKDRLREFITGSGMGFDAGTSIDKTVYELNNIPTDKENVLDSCMLIIQDWASGLSFEDQYIEKEKSIIGQEVLYIAQTGHGIVWDIQTQSFPDSKYSKKTIIGDEKVFSQFTADMLNTFYNNWYPPHFQAVVIVGDIHPYAIE